MDGSDNVRKKYNISNFETAGETARARKKFEEIVKNPSKGDIPVIHHSKLDEDYLKDSDIEELFAKRDAQRFKRSGKDFVPIREKAKQKRILSPKTVSIVLAALLAVGVIGRGIIKDPVDTTKISELALQGVEPEDLGLSKESVDALIEYNSFYEEGKNQTTSKQETLEKEREIYELNLNIIKEKMSKVTGYRIPQLAVFYAFNQADGTETTTVAVYKDHYDPNNPGIPIERYSNRGFLEPVDERTLPEEISEMILTLKELDELDKDIRNGKVSEKNAFNTLQKAYSKIQTLGAKVLEKNEKGILEYVAFDEQKDTKQLANNNITIENEER